MTRIIKLFPAIVLLFALSSCSLYEEVEMLGIQDYSVGSLDDSQVKATVVFKINNPNFYSIKIKKSDFEIYLDDDFLGITKMLNELKIIKKTEQNYTLELGIQQDELKKALLPLIKKAFFKKTVTVRVKGKTHCKVMGVFGKRIKIDESKEISLTDLVKGMKKN